MRKSGIICLAMALFAPCRLVSQDSTDWNTVLEHLLGNITEDNDIQQAILYFEELHDNPLNINRVSRQQLEPLTFLSEKDIEEICAYIYLHGPMLSPGELQMVYGLDYEKRRLLRQFIYIGPGPEEHEEIRLKDVFRYGRVEAVQDAGIPLYTREGYREHTADVLKRYPNREYLGTRVGHSLRLSLDWNSRIKFGLTAQKDAGEPFFEKHPAGYDFYSPYLFLNDIGRLKAAAFGRYKVSAGCGLLVGNGFGMASGADAAARKGFSIRPHSSCGETGCLTGAAVQWEHGRTGFALFASSQLTDAVLADDGSISSFKTDGYHRTQLEFSRKHNCRQNTAGAAVQYEHQGIAIGSAILLEKFSRRLSDGTGFMAGLSADFAIHRPGFAVWGETAADLGKRSIATLDNILIRLDGHHELTLSARYYSPRYESLHSGAMAQSDVSNEYGLLASVRRESGRFKADCTVDCFGHPEPCYQASAASHGMQFKSNTSIGHVLNGTLSGSFNYKAVQKDCRETGRLEYRQTWRFKLGHETGMSDSWNAKSSLLLNCSTFPGTTRSWGRALAGYLKYNGHTGSGWALDIYVSGCLFSTDSYDSAVSIYENGPRYGFGFMTLSGKGCRLSAMIKAALPNGFQLVAKTGSTIYSDRESMGSGAAKLDQSHKEDVTVQAIWKFRAADFLK